jgi:hypothetical protein
VSNTEDICCRYKHDNLFLGSLTKSSPSHYNDGNIYERRFAYDTKFITVSDVSGGDRGLFEYFMCIITDFLSNEMCAHGVE